MHLKHVRVRQCHSCQEPFAGFFTGLPRGVTVLSRPSCLILRRDQFESPNGQPRFILRCRAVCSVAVMGWLTCFSQPGFLGSGHFESSNFSRGVPECQRYRLLKRQSSARSTSSNPPVHSPESSKSTWLSSSCGSHDLRASVSPPVCTGASWQPQGLRVLPDETPSVSRMREIRTSGSMRGEEQNAPPLLD